jgi:hypothetical protein
MSKLIAAVLIVLAGCTTELAAPARPSIPTPTILALSASGLGPCERQWYMSCNYGIRVEGPGGYDHRGNFAWDEGLASPGPEPAHGPNGPVASTGIRGDVPATLPAGTWTLSFRLWFGSDAIQLVAVPGGTPRAREEDPFTAACSTQVDTSGSASLTVKVAFQGSSCTVETLLDGVIAEPAETPT